ncbi:MULTISPECIES: hypothetical protein [unclassified Bacillus (in: firmicutes)]|nr:hypothetical protein [Bacillus sp. BP-3]MDC2866891.1 hypothetical protein [Bacillus sp. BP-3]
MSTYKEKRKRLAQNKRGIGGKGMNYYHSMMLQICGTLDLKGILLKLK